MATFTHSTTWLVNIDGRSTSYTFSYDVDGVVDVQRITKEAGGTETFEIASEPALTVVLARSESVPVSVTLTENGTPSGVTVGYLREGEVFVSHLSDSGGTWNSTSSSATSVLQPLDAISVGSMGAAQLANFDVLILHQAAS